jgi:pyridoxine 5-phosphate synthase
MHQARLSVNINKIATLRNSRGGALPSVTEAAVMAQHHGAEGITVHPRPDERHIRYADVRELRPLVHTEFNIEGYPSPDFIDLVLDVRPEQVTLVPDPPGVLTSNAGWDTIGQARILTEVVTRFKAEGIRTSVFIGTAPDLIRAAAQTGTDRIELYTEAYAIGYPVDKAAAVAPFAAAALVATEVGLGINAGHDLNLQNLRYFALHVPGLLEVSIGHALISDCLYYGMADTIAMYLGQLRP